MDADHSGGISRGEWEKKFGKGSGKDFDRYDKNHDGELDRGEWSAIQRGQTAWDKAKQLLKDGAVERSGQRKMDEYDTSVFQEAHSMVDTKTPKSHMKNNLSEMERLQGMSKTSFL